MPVRILQLFIISCVVGSAACGGPTKPTDPPVDPFPDGPAITCPAPPQPVTSTNGGDTPVSFGTTTVNGGAPPLNTVCTKESGALFPLGSTSVTCTVTDSRQRTNSCSIVIVVQQPPKLSVTSFVAFGDSITAGEDGTSPSLAPAGVASRVGPTFLLPAPQRYPNVLEQLLRGRYTTQTPTVANAGQPEEKAGASATLSRFAGVLSQSSYGAVLIMEGTNDIYARDAGEIPASLQGLRNMIQTAKGRNVRPFLATVPPMVPNSARGLAWSLVPTINSGIRSLAASEDVPLVDIETAFGASYQQYIGFDGLHPNADGYAKIADAFFTAIKSKLEASTPTTSLSMPSRQRRSSR